MRKVGTLKICTGVGRGEPVPGTILGAGLWAQMGVLVGAGGRRGGNWVSSFQWYHSQVPGSARAGVTDFQKSVNRRELFRDVLSVGGRNEKKKQFMCSRS